MSQVYPKRVLVNEAFQGQNEVISKLLSNGKGYNRVRKGRNGYTGYGKNNKNDNTNNNFNNANFNNYQQVSRDEGAQQSVYYTPSKGQVGSQLSSQGNQVLTNSSSLTPLTPSPNLTWGTFTSSATSQKSQFDPFKPVTLDKYEVNLKFDNISQGNSIWNSTNTVWG